MSASHYTDTRRYLFPLPDVTHPVGGVNVIYGIIDELRAAGYQADPVHCDARYQYPFHAPITGAHAFASMARVFSSGSRKERLKAIFPKRKSGPARHDTFVPGPHDTVVIPEFAYGELAALFPQASRVLLAQDVFGFMRAFNRDMIANGPDTAAHLGFDHVITTSEVSTQAIADILGRTSHRLVLSVPQPDLPFQSDKKLQISYMPRKSPQEAALVVAGIKSRPALRDIPIVPIENMPLVQVQACMQESLIFLSFSKEEGFGLPPAEAMTAGCIVVGYTGVGGNEYFTPDRGFPVAQNDIIGLVKTVEDVVTAYQDDPAKLDQMRKAASDHIRSTYSAQKATESLLATWAKISKNS